VLTASTTENIQAFVNLIQKEILRRQEFPPIKKFTKPFFGDFTVFKVFLIKNKA
jgi:hypothetical protein